MICHGSNGVRAGYFTTLMAFLLPAFFAGNAGAADFPAPEIAMKQFKTPAGISVRLWATEPQLANPVCITLDEKGRVYIGETYRLVDAGVWDIRGHLDFYTEDLACRTVDDRAAMIRSHFGDSPAEFTKASEKIQILEDRSGRGKADHAEVFAAGFNGLLDGVGSGLLARKGDVYFTDIPELWMLLAPEKFGPAVSRKSLSHGYGVHFGYSGHDLHGLRIGPDGRLYFSEGDRGMHVTNSAGKVLDFPDTGGVYRCNLDGSDLELFATGLRNPQKLAFDDFGDLFTGDNNCDNGDAARLVYVVEGGDSGWRIANQFSDTTPAGVWMSEKLWHLQFPGQAAYIVPPIAHIADGPSGLAHYPGLGMTDNYQDHFFLCDFRGGSSGSGIHSFGVSQKGAGYEMVDHGHFFWNVLATDAEFGPDGWLYVSDWEEGWVHLDQGRIYRVGDTNLLAAAAVSEARRIIGEGMEMRSAAELGALLGHADQRIRQEAQFELADRAAAPIRSSGECFDVLLRTALNSENRLARLHGIWGVGQLGRKDGRLVNPLLKLLRDPDPEMRAQTAKVLGEAHWGKAAAGLIETLKDASPRARFFAALSLGKLGNPAATPPLLAMLRANADQDVFLRHAGVMGLLGCADAPALRQAARDASRSVRLAALLVMRRQMSPEVAGFLHDSDPLLVLEAARAINDAPIAAALPGLGALAAHPTGDFMKDWRAVNALERMGRTANAAVLVEIAQNGNAAARLRGEALFALENWGNPSKRDRITGLWRPLAARNAEEAAKPLRPVINQILAETAPEVRLGAIRAAAKLGLKEAAPELVKIARDAKAPADQRVKALATLFDFQDSRLDELAKLAASDDNKDVSKEGLRLQSALHPEEAGSRLAAVLEKGSVAEQQGALASLKTVEGPAADQLVADWLDRLIAGKVPPEIQLDLLDAAARHNSDAIKSKLAQYKASRPKDDEFAGFRETLQGGSAEAGRKIFMERQDASCVRCHKIKGTGGAVGPDLTGVITRHNREYLLESILFPNKQIAAGFESLVIELKNGDSVAGIVKSQTPEEITLMIPEDATITKVRQADIKARHTGLSAMPEGMGNILSKQDLRNLVEFLATEK